MPDRIITRHISPYIAAQGPASEIDAALTANLRRRVSERAICDDSLPVLVPLAELRAVLRALDGGGNG